jgi:hypothetical protein
LLIVYSENIYKLKKEIRKRDLIINEFEKKINVVLKIISEFKNGSEGKFKDEIIRLKRLRGI